MGTRRKFISALHIPSLEYLFQHKVGKKKTPIILRVLKKRLRDIKIMF